MSSERNKEEIKYAIFTEDSAVGSSNLVVEFLNSKPKKKVLSITQSGSVLRKCAGMYDDYAVLRYTTTVYYQYVEGD